MNNLQREFLNGLTTPLGYGYIEPDEVVDICVDNDISFLEFQKDVDWLDSMEMESIAEAYDDMTLGKDKDAREFLGLDEDEEEEEDTMSDRDTQLENWSRERL